MYSVDMHSRASNMYVYVFPAQMAERHSFLLNPLYLDPMNTSMPNEVLPFAVKGWFALKCSRALVQCTLVQKVSRTTAMNIKTE